MTVKHADAAKFTRFGYEFNKLTKVELEDIADELDLCINCETKFEQKSDYIFAIEQHYAKERMLVGKQPTRHLNAGFCADLYSVARCRQVFAQHGMRFTTDAPPIAICKLKAPELRAHLMLRLDEMRLSSPPPSLPGSMLPTHPSGQAASPTTALSAPTSEVLPLKANDPTSLKSDALDTHKLQTMVDDFSEMALAGVLPPNRTSVVAAMKDLLELWDDKDMVNSGSEEVMRDEELAEIDLDEVL